MLKSGLQYAILLLAICLFACRTDMKEATKAKVNVPAQEIKKEAAPIQETQIILNEKQAELVEKELPKESITVNKPKAPRKEIQKEIKKETQEVSVPAKPKTIVYAKPAIQFEHTTHDFGTLEEGETYDHVFKFKNTGNAALEITSASGTCGCAQPSFPFLEIPPGGTNQIGVHYNSVNKEGDQNPEIFVSTNIDNSKIKLTLTGTVVVSEERRKEKEEAVAKQKKAIAEAAAAAKKKREEKEKLIKARVDSILQAQQDTSKTITPKN